MAEEGKVKENHTFGSCHLQKLGLPLLSLLILEAQVICSDRIGPEQK